MRRLTKFKTFSQPKILVGLVVLAVTGIALGFNAPKAHAIVGDCDDNSIIRCGIGGTGSAGAASFIKKVRANDPNQGAHHDLISIYKEYGLDTSLYNKFATSARQGTAYKDGRIVVDGITVATDSNSIGRVASYQGSGYFRKQINTVVYFGNTNDRAFASDSLPVMVLFDDKGQALFAVLNSCGNPMGFTPKKYNYSCTNLTKTPVSGKPGTYKFTTNTRAGNGATITRLVYNFGDGTRMTSTDPNAAVTHTYTSSGTFRATVTVDVRLPFGGADTVGGAGTDCATLVTVQMPFYQCDLLAATPVNGSKYKYRFVVTGKAGNGARLLSADLNFGDGKHKEGIALSGGTTATYDYEYGKEGKFTATAKFQVSSPDGAKYTAVGSCVRPVSVAIPYYSCVQFTGTPINGTNNQYAFKATAEYGNGVTFTGADFNYGDTVTDKAIKPDGASVSMNHTYTTPGQYHIVATLYFKQDTAVQSATCEANITQPGQPTAQECKPGVPVGNPLCNPCTTNSALPADSKACVLPNTGAGNVIAIFGAVVVAGFLLFRQFISRRNFARAGVGVDELATAGHIGSEDYNNEVAEQMIASHAHHASAHHTQTPHRNEKPLTHATYHRPHRFRPRSHNDDK